MSPTNKIKSTRSRPSACFVCLFECEEQAWRVFGQLLTHVSVWRFSQWQPRCIHNHSKKTRFVHHALCISKQLFRLMRVIRSFNFRLSPRLTLLPSSWWHLPRCCIQKIRLSQIVYWNLTLTHWGRNEIDAISQTTFSNAFSWMKMNDIRLGFHWSLFINGLDKGLVPPRRQAIIWTNSG